VFGKSVVVVLDTGSPAKAPKGAERLAFLEAFKADLSGAKPYERSLELVSPPAWGKTVSADTGGVIGFHPSFAGGFSCHVALKHLTPNHDYILTLNGNPSRSGNSLLLSPVPGNEAERYYDFLIIKTDARGNYDASLGIFLKPARYDVRWYVKDTADFKIVLYRDFFEFQVE
jgi:hypothetical protein